MASPDPTAQFGTPTFYAALGRAFVVMCLVVPWLALIEFVDQRLDGSLDRRFGIVPHEVSGLDGVVFAPFLHFGWDHLLANSYAIIILGTFALAAGTKRFLVATWLIAMASGLAVWFLTPAGTLVLGMGLLAAAALNFAFVSAMGRMLSPRTFASLGVLIAALLAVELFPQRLAAAGVVSPLTDEIGTLSVQRCRRADLPSGVSFYLLTLARPCRPGHAQAALVSIGPGAIELAVIPNRAPSRAITFMKAITPPLDAL